MAEVQLRRSEPATQLTMTRADAIARFLNTLTPRQREVAECFMDGLRPVEVAHELGISRPRVYQLRNFLAQSLRARLAIWRNQE